LVWWELLQVSLTSESVEGSALALESIDHIHGGDGLPLGVLGVGDGITDDVLKEDLEDTSGLLIDEARDALDTTAASQTADGGLGDALDVVTKNLAVTLGASLAESLASFASSSHGEMLL
jgi:hypothetical protein